MVRKLNLSERLETTPICGFCALSASVIEALLLGCGWGSECALLPMLPVEVEVSNYPHRPPSRVGIDKLLVLRDMCGSPFSSHLSSKDDCECSKRWR